MFVWFFVFAGGFLLMIPLHFWSLEHRKLRRRFGKGKGARVGKILGAFSGWMELVFLLGLWISPQPRFALLPNYSIQFPLTGFSVPLSHLAVAVPFVGLGAWIAIRAVVTMERKVGFGVIDTHSKPGKIVTGGPYAIVRHPQYLGANLAHIGGSVLFSASFALLFSPIYITCNYLISRKEEKELVREYGEEYEDYRKTTPMLVPKIWKTDSD